MQLGVGLTETVNVSSEAPLLETSRADRGTVIDSARIAELPLQSRSPMALAVLVAGVNYNAQAIYLRPFDNGALADWSMNGGQNRNNEFLLDGAPNNANQGGNNIAYVPPAEAVQEFKVSTNSYDAQYGRTAGGVVNMSLKSGTNTFHGVGLRLHAAQGARRELVPAQLAQRAQDRSVHRPVRVQRRRSDLQEQDVLPVHRREVPRRHAGAAVQHGADGGDEERRLQRPRRRAGPADRRSTTRRPAATSTACGRAIRSRATSSPPTASTRRRGRSCSTTRIRTTRPPASRRGSRTCDYAEHFNKDLFWNWVGKVDHNFGPNDRAFFRWGENERNEVRNTTADPQRPGAGRPAAADPRQPRARRRLGAHLRRRHRVQPARQLHLLPRVEPLATTRSASIRPSSAGRRASSRSSRARRIGGMFPRIEIDRLRQPVARHAARTRTRTTRSSRTSR